MVLIKGSKIESISDYSLIMNSINNDIENCKHMCIKYNNKFIFINKQYGTTSYFDLHDASRIFHQSNFFIPETDKERKVIKKTLSNIDIQFNISVDLTIPELQALIIKILMR